MIIFPLVFLIYLLLIAMDVLIFFAIIRLLSYKWSIPCLDAFNATGTPLVDWFTNHIEIILSRVSNKNFSQTTQLSIGITVLILVRTVLTVSLCN
jgi:hypothetical protein